MSFTGLTTHPTPSITLIFPPQPLKKIAGGPFMPPRIRFCFMHYPWQAFRCLQRHIYSSLFNMASAAIFCSAGQKWSLPITAFSAAKQPACFYYWDSFTTLGGRLGSLPGHMPTVYFTACYWYGSIFFHAVIWRKHGPL